MKKKAPFPTMTEIADFLRDRSGKVGKREIARAFHLHGDDKDRLKNVLTGRIGLPVHAPSMA